MKLLAHSFFETTFYFHCTDAFIVQDDESIAHRKGARIVGFQRFLEEEGSYACICVRIWLEKLY